jgi:hypothetical protein
MDLFGLGILFLPGRLDRSPRRSTGNLEGHDDTTLPGSLGTPVGDFPQQGRGNGTVYR